MPYEQVSKRRESGVALNENLIDSLDISEFLDESRVADAEEVPKVMAASCMGCCSVS